MKVANMATILFLAGCASEVSATHRQQSPLGASRGAAQTEATPSAQQQQRELDAEQQAAREQAAATQRQRDIEAQAAADRKAIAERLLAECQAKLDADPEAGIACWNKHSEAWPNLGVSTRTVNFCLRSELERANALRTCVSLPEATDDEIGAKKECIESVRPSARVTTPELCAPLSVDSFDAKLVQQVGYDAVKDRLDHRADHLTLPGWKDVVVDGKAPSDVNRNCKT